jgi:hypothetical protein
MPPTSPLAGATPLPGSLAGLPALPAVRRFERRPSFVPGPAAILRGRFRLEHLLDVQAGDGVWLATDLRPAAGEPAGKRVIVRFYPEGADFQAWIPALARLGAIADPGIARILAIGSTGSKAYVVRDSVPGERLDRWLAEQGGRIPASMALALLASLARALEVARQCGHIVDHLSPAGILVDIEPFTVTLCTLEPPGPGAAAAELLAYASFAALVLGAPQTLESTEADLRQRGQWLIRHTGARSVQELFIGLCARSVITGIRKRGSPDAGPALRHPLQVPGSRMPRLRSAAAIGAGFLVAALTASGLSLLAHLAGTVAARAPVMLQEPAGADPGTALR